MRDNDNSNIMANQKKGPKQELTDTYIKKLIRAESKDLKYDDIPQNLVEAKRAQIELLREIRKH